MSKNFFIFYFFQKNFFFSFFGGSEIFRAHGEILKNIHFSSAPSSAPHQRYPNNVNNFLGQSEAGGPRTEQFEDPRENGPLTPKMIEVCPLGSKKLSKMIPKRDLQRGAVPERFWIRFCFMFVPVGVIKTRFSCGAFIENHMCAVLALLSRIGQKSARERYQN